MLVSSHGLLLLAGVLAGVTGCSGFIGPDGEDDSRAIGVIDAGMSLPTIEAPDTVTVDTWFTATVHTFGRSCDRPHSVELTLSPLEARVTPYIRVPDDKEGVCTADLRAHAHSVQLRFTQTGPATIVALGDVEIIENGVRRMIPGSVSKQLTVVER